MRVRLFFVGIILSVFFAATTAAAQKPLEKTVPFKPLSPWVVGTIQSESSSGIQYCSMKTTFSDGWDIVFARDVAGYNSLAIEVPRKIKLTPGSSYAVRLMTGEVIRDKTFIAATKNVLVTQMGIDEAFYRVLSRAPELSFTGQILKTTLSLEGAADSLKALEDCVNTRAKGKPFTERQIALSPVMQVVNSDRPYTRIPEGAAAPVAPVEEVGLVDTAELEDEVSRLREENKRLSQKLAQQEVAKIEPAAGMADVFESGFDLEDQSPEEYIGQLRNACADEFATKQSSVSQQNVILLAEIACIGSEAGGSEAGRAAALAFYQEGDRSKVRIFETATDVFDNAIQKRRQFLEGLR